jgi:predicted transcriptional regulator
MRDELVEASMETIRISVLWASAVAKHVGIQPTDLFAIAFLLEALTATAGELMETTGLTSGATTAMIDRLVSAGVVARERDPEDGRRVIVRLIEPPPSVEFIRRVTSQEIRKAVRQAGGIPAKDWQTVHTATSTAVRRAIEGFGRPIETPSKRVVSKGKEEASRGSSNT